MADSEDHSILATSFGWPSKTSAYLAITTPEGRAFRFHFDSKTAVSLFRAQAVQTEERWPDPK
jgi:hypothetical protein